MTDDAGDYVLGEDVLSDLWLLLEPLAEEASADLPLATPPGTPGAGVRDHAPPYLFVLWSSGPEPNSILQCHLLLALVSSRMCFA